jgi:hypothetical protein
MTDSPPGAGDPAPRSSPPTLTAGDDPRIAGWLRDLKAQLTRLEPYLAAGRIVTFAAVAEEEKRFFEWIVTGIDIPERVCAVFIPPSVVQQAMWPGRQGPSTGDVPSVYGVAPDAGAVVALRCGDLETIVNALFSFPPLAPGVDVYEHGRILAGYTFADHHECLENLSSILANHLV